jgi:gamma-glutamylcyclotransferase
VNSDKLKRTEELVTIFAYGSIMLSAKIRTRAPSATPRGVACLDQFTLRWNKRSKDGSGKCTIEQTSRPEDSVWGVLYELTTADKGQLDKFEGLGSGYEQRDVAVLLKGNRTRVSTYYATSVDPGLCPYDWYKEQVVIGATRQGLPAEYIRMLEAAPSTADPDPRRAEKERRFLRPQP